MKDKLSVMLSGLGYYQLSDQRRRNLLVCLSIGMAVNLFILIVFGSWALISQQRREETVFVAQAPLKTYEPREIEHRVKVQRRQQSSSRPAVTPRMVAQRVSDFSLPEITTDPSVIRTSFQPKFRAVTSSGMGMGLGTGYGLGGFGLGVSQFDFFGIRGRGNKIAIIVDISPSMINPESGGEEGFQRVRARLDQVVDALNEQALFNVIVFCEAASALSTEEMVIANDRNKQRAKEFVRPFNRNGNYGLRNGNVQPPNVGLPHSGGESRLDLAMNVAFEQRADTILVIADGLPRVRQHISPSAEQMAAYQRALEEWRRRNHEAMRRWEQAEANAPTRQETRRVWVADRRDGVDMGGRWEERTVTIRDNPVPRPGGAPQRPGTTRFWTLEDFKKHYELLFEEYYAPAGQQAPVVHAIGYFIDPEGQDFMRGLARAFRGQYRRVTSM